jgi:hypothetical protein
VTSMHYRQVCFTSEEVMNHKCQASGPRVAVWIWMAVVGVLSVVWLEMLMSGDASQAAASLGAGIAATAAAGGGRRSCRRHRTGQRSVGQ